MHLHSPPTVSATPGFPDAAAARSRIEDALQMLQLLRITEAEQHQLGHVLLGIQPGSVRLDGGGDRVLSSHTTAASPSSLPDAGTDNTLEGYLNNEADESVSCISISTTSSRSSSPVFTVPDRAVPDSAPVSPFLSAVQEITYTHRPMSSPSARSASHADAEAVHWQDIPHTPAPRRMRDERTIHPGSNTPPAPAISSRPAVPPAQHVPLSYARAAPPTFPLAPVEGPSMAGHHQVVYLGATFWVPNVGTAEPYHTVIKGTRVGIFCDWGRASEYVTRVKGNIHFRVDDWVTAVDSVKSAVEDGRLQVLH
ncbi:hypothetical protein CONPUDRAFT_77945 [Coniophora puteana RWD-64-598 SS2]|uniref:Uncharacterized protein n=1 Tax=Coniophora puteana (strain RWD-64-598) TaxID=741705 RepID=R7SES1_CONPW|nr:uncharacterized protein CONPUDRAFT_77945 [Coniophora puteana RWD-64-598 SS2]EIW74673.1 hypothetical protein CONPUDRAFT_77945 [Coniophora puteana RWD-64-598 SS2]